MGLRPKGVGSKQGGLAVSSIGTGGRGGNVRKSRNAKN